MWYNMIIIILFFLLLNYYYYYYYYYCYYYYYYYYFKRVFFFFRERQILPKTTTTISSLCCLWVDSTKGREISQENVFQCAWHLDKEKDMILHLAIIFEIEMQIVTVSTNSPGQPNPLGLLHGHTLYVYLSPAHPKALSSC